MNPFSPDFQRGIKSIAEDEGVIRKLGIFLALAISIVLGYRTVVMPSGQDSVLLDVAFVGSVIAFLALLVSVLGDQLRITIERDPNAERNTHP